MDKLRAMATFVRIVNSGSLTAAAGQMGQSPAAVVRQLAALEAHLGTRLLNRSTRRLALTEEGQEYLLRCRRILADVEEAESLMSDRRQHPAGRLTITAPVMFGRRHVSPLVNAFLAEHPAMQIELLLIDRVVDMLEEGIDLAIRIGELADSSMVALPVGATGSVVCASPDYLRRRGEPRHPSDLSDHDCIVFSRLSDRGWSFADGKAAWHMPVRAVLTTNQVDAALDGCRAGLGCAQLLHYQVADSIMDGSLVRILTGYEVPRAPIHIVYPNARLLSLRVRRFIDWAQPRLRRSVPVDDGGSRIAPVPPTV